MKILDDFCNNNLFTVRAFEDTIASQNIQIPSNLSTIRQNPVIIIAEMSELSLSRYERTLIDEIDRYLPPQQLTLKALHSLIKEAVASPKNNYNHQKNIFVDFIKTLDNRLPPFIEGKKNFLRQEAKTSNQYNLGPSSLTDDNLDKIGDLLFEDMNENSLTSILLPDNGQKNQSPSLFMQARKTLFNSDMSPLLDSSEPHEQHMGLAIEYRKSENFRHWHDTISPVIWQMEALKQQIEALFYKNDVLADEKLQKYADELDAALPRNETKDLLMERMMGIS
jgi:hypothetical protein